jgi:hypothetical protein
MPTLMNTAKTARTQGQTTRTAAVPKLLAVALPMLLVTVLPASAQVPSPPVAAIGTIMTLQDAGQIGGKAAAAPKPYAVSLTVSDTGKGAAEAQAPAALERVDVAAPPSEDGKPGRRKPAMVEAPAGGCEATKAGKKPRSACADRPTTGSLVAEPAQTYRRPEPRSEHHREALSTPERRVLTVIYASLARLGRIK